MTAAPDLTGWWEVLEERLAGTAVAVGATSPGQGLQYWSAGSLSQQPVTRTTTFYAASVTKQLIAALVARAVLDGRVDLRTSVAALLPELPAWTAPIRVHHLLHHTAALPQPRVLAALHYVTPPAAPPGRKFSYDNTGYVLLAEMLRDVWGQDVTHQAAAELFGPLGLAGSRLGGLAPVMLPGHVAPPETVGDGGLWTCSADLLTWLQAMNGDRLGADLTTMVQSPGHLDSGAVLDYAWALVLDLDARVPSTCTAVSGPVGAR